MDETTTVTSAVLKPVTRELHAVAPCPVCSEQGGFHNAICYTYSRVSEPFIGPGNSKAFMDYLRERFAREQAAKDAVAKAKRMAR